MTANCHSCSTDSSSPPPHCQGNADRSCVVEETISTILTTLDLDVVVDRTARLHFGRRRLQDQAAELSLNHGAARGHGAREMG